MTRTPRTTRKPSRTGATGLAAGALIAAVMGLPTSGANAAPLTAPVFKVTQEGLTAEQASALAERAGVGNAVRPDGTFGYVGNSFAKVPSKKVPRKARKGKTEDGRSVAQAVNRRALASTEVIGDRDALAMAAKTFDEVGTFSAIPQVDHTTVDISNARGKLRSSTAIDTTVTYRFELDGRPVVGPGAKQRIAFDGDGSVVQLSHAMRSLEQSDDVPIIDPETARGRCSSLYGDETKQRTPELAYYAPPLAAEKASGRGAVELVLPHYVCNPSGVPRDHEVPLTGRLIPAAEDFTPVVALDVAGDGRTVQASAAVKSGQEPYSFDWSATSADLSDFSDNVLKFGREARSRRSAEVVTVQVTDANGIVSTASVQLMRGSGRQSAEGYGGMGGAFAEAGIEQTVDEWQCAQDSADGFGDVMRSQGETVDFDWRGANAWERDFKKTSIGGIDSSYVDEVDIQWYTGHGSPNSFTFKGSNDDGSITPSDAEWGDNNDLEWMQLESCQVLRDTNGAADYFARWAPVFDGLHLLNGFDTNAYCIGGGTGERFAELLFPENFLWWQVRAPLTVQQAWSTMANELEPAGVRWRSISPMNGSVHNLNDKYHGEGTVGPDISSSQRTGFIAVSGVS